MSGRVAAGLAQAGHDAIHLVDLQLLGAQDDAVLAAAAGSGRVLLSADTDFGELLALGRHPGPSVVLFRRAPRRPDGQVLGSTPPSPTLESRCDLRLCALATFFGYASGHNGRSWGATPGGQRQDARVI